MARTDLVQGRLDKPFVDTLLPQDPGRFSSGGHLVSMAPGGGIEAEAMYCELRGAWSYCALTRES